MIKFFDDITDGWKSYIGLVLVVFSLALVGCESPAPVPDVVPGVKGQTWTSMVICNPEGETLEFSFTAEAAWTAKSDGSWYQVSPTSGVKGSSTIQIAVSKNTSKASRSAEIVIYVKGYNSASFTIKQDRSTESEVKGETEMNKAIDEYLLKNYLWNDEYKGMTRDLDIPYKDSYENFLKKTLINMSTNTLDKKKNQSGAYNLYSYIDRTDKKAKSKSVYAAGVNHGVEKEDKVSSFGIVRLEPLSFSNAQGNSTGKYGFAVQAVYPTSSAQSMGVKRGNIIYKVDDKEITPTNYMSLYLNLLNPTANSVKLSTGYGTEEPKDVYLQATQIDPTPILKQEVLEEEGHRIGYLVYDSFDAAYDNDLLGAISSFKSKGITDLILDFRYNGGGYMISSMMLSSCVAGSVCKNQIFQYYRYNSTRMSEVETTKKVTGYDYDATAKYFYNHFIFDNYYGVNLSSYALDLKRVFVLTTVATASASEVLINSLRGIGLDVVVIGEPTNGKNVGMEVDRFTVGNYDYELAPITFQYYNANKETVPEDGFKIDEYEGKDCKVNDWNNGYVDFGEKEEPMLAKAIELITGKAQVQAKARSVARLNMQPVSVELPALKQTRPQGVLVLKPEVE